MDAREAAEAVMKRISKLESESVAKKILGYMFLQDIPDQEMIRYALGPDILIHDLIQRAKTAHIMLVDSFGSNETITMQQYPPPPAYPAYPMMEYCPDGGCSESDQPPPVKICHYHKKGYCKHGMNCRYYHHMEEMMFPNPPNHRPLEGGDDGMASLEYELIQLLRSRRGSPVSIASLPTLYCDMYGKTLQAQGYLTESQRHGKAGYSLTKLLARLSDSIKIVIRPHGQHAVLLAEDAPKYLDVRAQKNDPGPIVSDSRQIYLTFPAESTFTEEDVIYGPVEDVRIPCQQKRMYGFVTFDSVETVKLILSKGNPHYVCDARVLVKPYREKPKHSDRKYAGDKAESPLFHRFSPLHITYSDPQAGAWESSSMRSFTRSPVEEHGQLGFNFEMGRLSNLRLSCEAMSSQSCLAHSMEQLNVQEEERNHHHMLNVLNYKSISDDLPKLRPINCGDQESSTHSNIILPENPFTPTSSISA
ncbi:hypothetical protein M569_16007 [Genlisea aurea]|uniref:C3H1-type domain-containing protein n=1 Tax=Genlisea aurea TaxID=192259 RepID=S8C340_9LAMI|nr:hypothetical protein M569_16007 [Genlisea aurea]